MVGKKKNPKKVQKAKVAQPTKKVAAEIAKKKPAVVVISKKDSVVAPKEKEVIEKRVAPEANASQHERYWEAVGRRKTAVARVRLYTRGDKNISVNGKPAQGYFQYASHLAVIEDPLKKMKSTDRFRVSAKVSGGGTHAQAEAIRHGISRALVEFNADFRKRLKRAGFLTRDPRMKERKKFGLKGARRAPQWAKR